MGKENIETNSNNEMKIQTLLIPIDFSHIIPHGYANGYIGLPKEHPWFNKHYDNIDVDIHGGLTYSNDHPPKGEPDGLWWTGFDTAHCYDNQVNCDETYCRNEVESLKQQALNVVK